MFPIRDWLVFQSVVKEGLQKIVYMHHVFPIPAYELQGHIIPHIQYCKWLEGAVVELHFELNHWSIGGSDNDPNSDTYSADMMPIWVLIPPKPCIVMPMKHKSFCQIDPLEFQPRRAIANVSSFPISYFISLTSHLSLHSGLHVFSCTIRYYLIPQVFP
jgi:hypothetical protein